MSLEQEVKNVLNCTGITIASSIMIITASSQVSLSHPLIIGPGLYIFENALEDTSALAFNVTVLNPSTTIDFTDSNGGTIFPNKVTNEANTFISYSGPSGVPGFASGFGFYAHDFSGWSPNTQFDVDFSYGDNSEEHPFIINSFAPGEEDLFLEELNNRGISVDQLGRTVTTQEPTTTFGFLALGLIGIISTFRQKQNSSKSSF